MRKGSDANRRLRPMDDHLTRAQALRSPPSNLKPRRQSSTLRAQSLVFAGMEAHAPAPPLPSAPERLVNIMLSPVKMTLGIDDEESAGPSLEPPPDPNVKRQQFFDQGARWRLAASTIQSAHRNKKGVMPPSVELRQMFKVCTAELRALSSALARVTAERDEASAEVQRAWRCAASVRRECEALRAERDAARAMAVKLGASPWPSSSSLTATPIATGAAAIVLSPKEEQQRWLAKLIREEDDESQTMPEDFAPSAAAAQKGSPPPPPPPQPPQPTPKRIQQAAPPPSHAPPLVQPTKPSANAGGGGPLPTPAKLWKAATSSLQSFFDGLGAPGRPV